MPSRSVRGKWQSDSSGPIAKTCQDEAAGPHFPLPSPTPSQEKSDTPKRVIPNTVARVWSVAHWECQGFFRRPVGYLMLLAGVLISSWSFAWLVTLIARGGGTVLVQADDPIVQFLGPNIFLTGFCTLIVPLLTMNLVADERRHGTLELLLTTPLSTGEALVGKFLATWSLFLAMLAPWGLQLLVLRLWSGATSMLWGVVPVPSGHGLPFDSGIFAGGTIGLALVAGTQIAIGLLCSSACRRPVVAALATFATLLGLLALGVLPRVLEVWSFPRERIAWIEDFSPWSHLDHFSRGKFLPRVFVGHISVWICLLGLAARVSRHVDEGD